VRACPVGVEHPILLGEIPRSEHAAVLRGDVGVGGERGDAAPDEKRRLARL
jgi:hypothetical protein